MKKAKKDYEDCMSIMVPVPADDHKDLKMYCVQHGITMKEVLHEIVTEGIRNRCK